MEEKEKRIKKEKSKLTKIFKNLDVDKDKMKLIESSVNNLAWMAVALEDLQADINANGYYETYNNGGGQTGIKDSTSVKAYNSLIKNYNSLIKTVSAFLPDNNENKSTENKFAKLMMQND
jgi:hypothetical protein